MQKIAQIDFERIYRHDWIVGGDITINKDTTVASFFVALYPYIFFAAGVLLLLYLIYGGIHFMISAGDPKGTQEAKGKITNAFFGFLIVFTAYWVVRVIGLVFGLDSFGSTFTP